MERIWTTELAAHAGERVRLCGWLHRLRQLSHVSFLVLRVHRLQVRTGREGLVHARGEARGALEPRGKVFVQGEIWNAVADEPVASGAPIEVVAVDGMTLVVRPLRLAAEGGSA